MGRSCQIDLPVVVSQLDAVTTDPASLAAISQEALGDTAPTDGASALLSFGASASYFRRLLHGRDGAVVGAHRTSDPDKGALVGFAHVGSSPFQPPSAGGLEVAVFSSANVVARGQGVGHKLTLWRIAWARSRGYSRVESFVYAYNAASLANLTKAGFSIDPHFKLNDSLLHEETTDSPMRVCRAVLEL